MVNNEDDDVENGGVGGDSFKLRRTDPALPSDTARRLQDTLNRTKDLSGFVVALRKAFKAMADA